VKSNENDTLLIGLWLNYSMAVAWPVAGSQWRGACRVSLALAINLAEKRSHLMCLNLAANLKSEASMKKAKMRDGFGWLYRQKM